jgi:RHS repeat-associated protein
MRNISDYSPFGVLLPERTTESAFYRKGFQGQEGDSEIKGAGNSVNYKYRMHDPRVGRFFAVDPLAASYPHNSPFAFSENILINAVELEGLEKMYTYVYNSESRKFDYTWTKINKELKENVNRYVYFDVKGNVSKTVIHSMDGERSKTFQGKETFDGMRLYFKSTKNEEIKSHSDFEMSFKVKGNQNNQWEGNNEPANDPDPRTLDAIIEVGKRSTEYLIEKTFPFEFPIIIPELLPDSQPYDNKDKILNSNILDRNEQSCNNCKVEKLQKL